MPIREIGPFCVLLAEMHHLPVLLGTCVAIAQKRRADIDAVGLHAREVIEIGNEVLTRGRSEIEDPARLEIGIAPREPIADGVGDTAGIVLAVDVGAGGNPPTGRHHRALGNIVLGEFRMEASRHQMHILRCDIARNFHIGIELQRSACGIALRDIAGQCDQVRQNAFDGLLHGKPHHLLGIVANGAVKPEIRVALHHALDILGGAKHAAGSPLEGGFDLAFEMTAHGFAHVRHRVVAQCPDKTLARILIVRRLHQIVEIGVGFAVRSFHIAHD